MTDTIEPPTILTNKQQRECHDRWLRFKREYTDRVKLAYGAFMIAERSVLAFGPHLEDVWWVNASRLFEDVYGGNDPVFHLLDVLHFPDHSEVVDRTMVADTVRRMIVEHDTFGGESGYMERSVVMGWVLLHHDALLGDINEAA